MVKLKANTAAGIFDIATPLLQRKCVANATASFVPCAGGALGYTLNDLLQAINDALLLPDWRTFVGALL